jgi:hypothetical protein
MALAKVGPIAPAMAVVERELESDHMIQVLGLAEPLVEASWAPQPGLVGLWLEPGSREPSRRV